MFLEDKQHTFWAPLQLTWTPIAPCLNDIQHIHIHQWTTYMSSNSTCQEVNVVCKYTIEHSVFSGWEPLGQFIHLLPLHAHTTTNAPLNEHKAFRYFGTILDIRYEIF